MYNISEQDRQILIKAVEVEFNLSEPIAPIALDKIFMIQNVSKKIKIVSFYSFYINASYI